MAAHVPVVAAIARSAEERIDDGRSPLIAVHRIRVRLQKEGPLSSESSFRKMEIRRFLLLEISKETECADIFSAGRSTQCYCMSHIDNLSEAEAVMMIDNLFGFALLHKSEQQNLLKEWIKYADTMSNAYTRHEGLIRKTTFLLPGSNSVLSARMHCADCLVLEGKHGPQ
jgi:hypothetical protein